MGKGFFEVPLAINEPIKSYAPGTPERDEVLKQYKEYFDGSLEVPLYIGSDEITTSNTRNMSPPHDHKHVLGKYHLAEKSHVSLAIENAQLYMKLGESYRSLKKAKQSIEMYSKALDKELETGRKIQKDFLPHQIPHAPNCEIATYFHPALQLSGDFYDVFLLPDNRLGLVIADISGKGVGSALFMALLRSLIRVFLSRMEMAPPILNPLPICTRRKSMLSLII